MDNLAKVDLADIGKGDIVAIEWAGTLFDPDCYVRPGMPTPDPEIITSVGFVSELSDSKISLSTDAVHEGGEIEPSFRVVVAIPTEIIKSCTKLGSLVSPAIKD